ncbi:glutamate-1-semialdehyde 2,1-aminomutase [soil metagenome]
MSHAVSSASASLADNARSVLAGGVSASMRIHPYLGQPFYVSRGDGAYIYDLEGKQYIDLNMSNGATMLGHGNAATRDAIARGLELGTIAAAETTFQEQLARTLTEIIPSAKRVRFASTGTEVTTVAIRLARHVTGRTKVLKFDGHFHGLAEMFLYRSGDDLGSVVPSSAGVPESGADDIVMVAYNDTAGFDAALERHRGEIAAVIVEPVHYNVGCITPEDGFLEHLRAATTNNGVILIFDEVLSGFRMDLGGAQTYYGVTPDLSTWAKALANGMPLSALTGRADIMEQLAPGGPVAHSGTYSGHLLSVLASIASVDQLRKEGVYDRILETSEVFYRDLQRIFDRHNLPILVQGLGARFGLYFGRTEPVRTYTDAVGHDHEMNRKFVLSCLERGVYFHAYNRAGAPGHCGFSMAHSQEDFNTVLSVIDDVSAVLAGSR